MKNVLISLFTIAVFCTLTPPVTGASEEFPRYSWVSRNNIVYAAGAFLGSLPVGILSCWRKAPVHGNPNNKEIDFEKMLKIIALSTTITALHMALINNIPLGLGHIILPAFACMRPVQYLDRFESFFLLILPSISGVWSLGIWNVFDGKCC